MERKFIVFVVAMLILTSLLAGCGQQKPAPVEVKVTLSEFKIEASPVSVPANTPIKFVVTNAGTLPHEMVLEKKGDVDKPLEVNNVQAEAGDIDPGKIKVLEWTVTEPGEYQLGCHVPGHFEAGMTIPFTVTK